MALMETRGGAGVRDRGRGGGLEGGAAALGAGPGALMWDPGGIDFCAVCLWPPSKDTPSVCRLRRVPFNYPPRSLIEMILN